VNWLPDGVRVRRELPWRRRTRSKIFNRLVVPGFRRAQNVVDPAPRLLLITTYWYQQTCWCGGSLFSACARSSPPSLGCRIGGPRVERRGDVLPLEPAQDLIAKTGCRLGLGGGLGYQGGGGRNRRDGGLSLKNPRLDNVIYPPKVLECKFCCFLTGLDFKLKAFERDDGLLDI